MVEQIRDFINDIMRQTTILRQNIQILNENVIMLSNEVDSINHRNELLSAQIDEIRKVIRAKLKE